MGEIPLKAIVIGAGYGGLAAAIELRRKGAEVEVFEATKELTRHGDILQIASNATRVMAKWGSVLNDVKQQSSIPPKMRCQNTKGETLLDQPLPPEVDGFPNVYVHRSRTQLVVYEHAVSLGITFHFGHRITNFFEEDDHAGVEFGGNKYTADVVVVADGVHSRARPYITGEQEKPKSSGFAVYRSWFSLDILEGVPALEEIVRSKEDVFLVWIGPNTHAIVLTNTKLRHLVCFCTHKDTYTVEESWSFPGKVSDMLEVVKGWDPRLQEVIKRIPPEALIDWKLLWRDPIAKWVSPKGRMVLVGDSAHPHLATSGQGAAQAIEDGATLGVMLTRAGRGDVPTALHAFEKIRYWRTNLTQRMGWELRHVWHRTDWDAVKANPEILRMQQPTWLFGGDSEKYAEDSFESVMQAVRDGKPFEPTNVPAGYRPTPWTIEDIMELEKGISQDHLYMVKSE